MKAHREYTDEVGCVIREYADEAGCEVTQRVHQ